MYVPKQFEETDAKAIRALIEAYPLATIVNQSADGLNANHIPLVFAVTDSTPGQLHGHVPRSNSLVEQIRSDPAALIIFHGPQSYVSPSWYATKAETGKVVPTWNYAVVHVYGRIHLVEDAHWLRRQVDALTAQQEATFDSPWAVSDAPAKYTNGLLRGLVGLEISIERIVAKTKASQNQPPRNREGVTRGLQDVHGDASSDLVSVMTRPPPGDR